MMNCSLMRNFLSLVLVALCLILPAAKAWGQDEGLDTSHTDEEEPFYSYNIALASAGATAFASSTSGAAQASGTYTPMSLLDGERSGLNWGNNGGWRCATADDYPDWVEIHFNGPKTIREVDVFTVQDSYNSPGAPTLDQTFSLLGITDFIVQYWDGAS